MKHYPLSNKGSAKAILHRITKRNHDRISVNFPFNDYIINGKVKCCEPTATRKVYWDGPYGPYVRFDKRRFYLKAKVVDPQLTREDGSKYRAYISISTK